ncbi:hypothetical protein [Leptolyngbya sp. CCY15150]|uniref:hypothetical protein n=1 Tax=Leptolyngbya sp. CCY15150 TaxID=2767772 RepID=UPI00195112B8|nr:hypothetical protein [Leptolyngbya sp. CCY15150]
MPPLHPASLEDWFAQSHQQAYIDHLRHIKGLTARRATCFIRLWVYLMLKHLHQAQRLQTPIHALIPLSDAIACTHREAAEVFYAHGERGSDRAAGLMIDRLVALGLLDKTFDGNTTLLKVRAVTDLLIPPTATNIALYPDQFNPRRDAVLVAAFLAKQYNWLTANTNAVAHQTARQLRHWASLYPKGMRVLRRTDNHNPVGFYIMFPVSRISEERFFQPPRQSLHLSKIHQSDHPDADPIAIAHPGDDTCWSVFVRSWHVDKPYVTQTVAAQFLQDSQQILAAMRTDFPNLCDIHTIPIHPSHEALAQALGFQKTIQDSQTFLYWVYSSLDQFLELDIPALAPHLPIDEL